MRENDALSPNTMSTSMQDDDHSEASSLSSFEGPLPERPSEARRRIAPIVPGFFDRAVFADRPNSALDSARPTSAANAEELGCTRLNRLIFIGGRAIESDLMALRKRRITHVLNMAVETENFLKRIYCIATFPVLIKTTMVGISVHHYTASSTSSTAPAWRRAGSSSTATRASLALLLRC